MMRDFYVAPGLTDPQQKILDVINMLRVRGITADRECVAAWLDIHPRGGRYGENLKALRDAGTLSGFELSDGAVHVNQMNTGVEGAMEALSNGSLRKLLATIVENSPITREDLALLLGLHPRGGRFGENLSQLRTMGLITGGKSIEATPELFK